MLVIRAENTQNGIENPLLFRPRRSRSIFGKTVILGSGKKFFRKTALVKSTKMSRNEASRLSLDIFENIKRQYAEYLRQLREKSYKKLFLKLLLVLII